MAIAALQSIPPRISLLQMYQSWARVVSLNARFYSQVLTAAIMSEEEKTRVLADRASGNAFYGVQDTALAQLAAKVLEVYVRDQIGFDNDASVGTLQMLTNFEVGYNLGLPTFVSSLSFLLDGPSGSTLFLFAGVLFADTRTFDKSCTSLEKAWMLDCAAASTTTWALGRCRCSLLLVPVVAPLDTLFDALLRGFLLMPGCAVASLLGLLSREPFRWNQN